MKPLISVVITTHNRCDKLKNALISVSEQTYDNIEIIVVDDNSTDGTKKMCDEFSSGVHLTYIYIPQTKSKGGNHARNVGILAANGKYVALMDDDDTWSKNKIEDQVCFLQENQNCAGVVCSYTEIFIQNDKTYASLIDKYYYKIVNDEFLNNDKAFPYAFVGITSALMLDRLALIDVGMFDEELIAFQEVEMIYRFRKKYRIGALKNSYVNYYNYFNVNKGQVSNSTERTSRALDYIEKKYANDFENMGEKAKSDWNITKLSCLYDRASRSGDKKMSLVYGKKAMHAQSGMKKKAVFLVKFIIIYLFSFETFIKIKSCVYGLKSKK